MTENVFSMTLNEMGWCLLTGSICAVVYLYLLWKTVRLLPSVKHKGLFLFISMALRIFLLLVVMLLFSGKRPGPLLVICCGFLIMRLFILRLTRFGAYNREEDKQMQKAFNGKKRKK